MRTKKKRITAMFMSVMLAASTAAGTVPVTVHAEGDVTVNMANIGVPLLNAANRDLP